LTTAIAFAPEESDGLSEGYYTTRNTRPKNAIRNVLRWISWAPGTAPAAQRPPARRRMRSVRDKSLLLATGGYVPQTTSVFMPLLVHGCSCIGWQTADKICSITGCPGALSGSSSSYRIRIPYWRGPKMQKQGPSVQIVPDGLRVRRGVQWIQWLCQGSYCPGKVR